MEHNVQKSKNSDDCQIVEELAIERIERAQQRINTGKEKDEAPELNPSPATQKSR
jgi:hypothetical protein